MKKSKTISKHPPESKNLDYDYLYNRALNYLQEMSGDIWTDYNLHDPGVTILEYLCYGLTDLAYRTSLPTEDLLYAKTNGREDKIEDTLFPPAEIYPSAPLTNKDYRKLLLDQVSELQNCWIEKENSPDSYAGLYTVFLLLHDRDYAAQSQVQGKVSEVLAANRNLGEDFSKIKFLTNLKVGILAEVSVSYNVHAETVMTKILSRIRHFFSLGVSRTSFNELTRQQISLADIYEGPQLQNGFIDGRQLKARRTSIHINEVRELISDIEGVIQVRELRFKLNGIATNQEKITFTEEQFPIYDTDFMHEPDLPIRLDKNGRHLALDLSEVKRDFHAGNDNKHLQKTQSVVFAPKSKKQSALRREELTYYTSIQNFFPHIYGITRQGLPLRAPKSQRVKAKQLKGYLLLFEHFFSTYLAVLGHLPHLFSVSEKSTPYQFDFLPLDVPDINFLLGKTDAATEEEKIAEFKLKSLHLASVPPATVKNAILNHLLARFNEEFPAQDFSEFERKLSDSEESIRRKKEFLRNYPELSRRRGTGLNYTKSGWQTENVSGLKKRVSLQLGFPDYQNRYLAKHIFSGEILKTGTSDLISKPLDFKLPVRDLLLYGADKNAYHLHRQGAYCEVRFGSPELPDAGLVYRSADREECRKAAENLRERVREINRRSTGFFVVEHILLRPRNRQKKRLVIYDADGNILLKDHATVHDEEKEQIADFVLFFGQNQDNYRIRKIDDDSYTIRLYNENGRLIMESPNRFNLPAARRTVRHIIEQLHEAAKNPGRINEILFLRTENTRTDSARISPDFYNFRLSFIIPKYTKRFFNRQYREVIKSTIAENMPAHLKPEFYWLSAKDMQKFESLYEPWLKATDRPAQREALSEKLALFLINTEK